MSVDAERAPLLTGWNGGAASDLQQAGNAGVRSTAAPGNVLDGVDTCITCRVRQMERHGPPRPGPQAIDAAACSRSANAMISAASCTRSRQAAGMPSTP